MGKILPLAEILYTIIVHTANLQFQNVKSLSSELLKQKNLQVSLYWFITVAVSICLSTISFMSAVSGLLYATSKSHRSTVTPANFLHRYVPKLTFQFLDKLGTLSSLSSSWKRNI